MYLFVSYSVLAMTPRHRKTENPKIYTRSKQSQWAWHWVMPNKLYYSITSCNPSSSHI